ncbi:Fatty acid metabolism regulator protein [Paraliobacillus sp. PM-2]|uniref:TetR/AcrR family transcriptional regulator n=1 Tax=Paraliobacillus sp. PM-2 TaxID=1462524 RepID=UPI00061BFF14|nr:TetR/AcrR family transcriptional regulator [Paraliobacillus sp. PM-2]CQR46186.1 Fatty acid metabolism regulator protein [Paraliobacillus sp. PM-2]
MNEKKQRIMEESMKLFAEKGFHATSIQEIARKSEVSKGAFYLYFTSKEELTIEIFDYYTSLIMDKFSLIQKQEKDAKQKLVEQITFFLDLITNHKEYMIMHLRDNIHIGQDINDLVLKLNQRAFEWIKTALTEIYGEKINPYIVDFAIHLDGILQGYSKTIVMHDLYLDNPSLANFIVDRLDNMIMGTMNMNAQAQIQIEQLSFTNVQATIKKDNIEQLINELSNTIPQLTVAADQKKQLQEAAQMIKDEVQKPKQNRVILEGILMQLKGIPLLEEQVVRLSNELAITIK